MLKLMKKDIRVLFSQKRIWILLFGVLIIGLVSTSWNASADNTDGVYISIGVIDLDDSAYSQMLLTYFTESEIFTEFADVIIGSQAEIKQEFEEGKLTVYLEIPKDFAQNLINIKNVPVKAVINTSDKTRAIIVKNMLEAYAKYIKAVETNCVALYDVMQEAQMPDELTDEINVKISYDLVFTALGKSEFFDYIEFQDIMDIKMEQYYSFVIIFLFLTYFSMTIGMDILKERRQGLFTRLIITGTKVSTIIAQKLLLYVGIFGATLALIQAMLGLYNKSIPAWLICIMLFYFAFAGIFFIFLGAFFRKIPNYMLFSNILVFFKTILGGGMIPVMYLPQKIRKLACLTPNYWFVSSALEYQNKQKQLSLFHGAICICCLLLFWFLTSLLYRKREGGVREDV